jgi:branched-subunit amino acid aminotransferase/4-amino-4-deoxychorismate lyase
LPGITRQRLLTLSKEHGIACFEHRLDKALLSQAEAAFTTNTLQGIQAIASWDACVFNSEHPLIAKMKTLLINE